MNPLLASCLLHTVLHVSIRVRSMDSKHSSTSTLVSHKREEGEKKRREEERREGTAKGGGQREGGGRGMRGGQPNEQKGRLVRVPVYVCVCVCCVVDSSLNFVAVVVICILSLLSSPSSLPPPYPYRYWCVSSHPLFLPLPYSTPSLRATSVTTPCRRRLFLLYSPSVPPPFLLRSSRQHRDHTNGPVASH